MSTENYLKRKRLRKNLLLNVYNYYFKNSGASLHVNVGELRENSEEYLAYKYLQQKGLIVVDRPDRHNSYIKPTVAGIDIIENNVY